MINFWLHEKDPFFISNDRKLEDGSMILSYMSWFEGMYTWYEIEVNVDFLNRGFKI